MENSAAVADSGLTKVLKNVFYGTFALFSIAGVAYIGYRVYEDQKNSRSSKKGRKKHRSDGRKKGEKKEADSGSESEPEDDKAAQTKPKVTDDAQHEPLLQPSQVSKVHKKRMSGVENLPVTALSSKPGSQRTIKSI